MKIAIVDDMPQWQKAIEQLADKYLKGKIDRIDIFSNDEEMNYEEKYDVLFLDIEMPGYKDGFEIAERYRYRHEDTVIIFLTTHAELGRKGYMVNAFRYIDKKHIEEEMDEALKALMVLRSREKRVSFNVVFKGETNIPIKSILFIETEKRNVIVHTKDKNYISSRQIEDFEGELKDCGFFRTHKSYLVNLENIDDFDQKNIYFGNGTIAMVAHKKYVELKRKCFQQKFNIANS